MLSISAVSLRADGNDTGNVGSTFSQQSADGRFAVFESLASNLTTTDKDPSTIPDLTDLDHKDVFRRDLTTGKTVLAPQRVLRSVFRRH